MECGDNAWIWEQPDWPAWRYDLDALLPVLFDIAALQGRLLGRLTDVGFALRDQASLAALTDDVVKTSAIEGEVLDVTKVRSSLARRRSSCRRRCGGSSPGPTPTAANRR